MFKQGDKVVVRSSPSGCWYGEVAGIEGTTVDLVNARRLWRWWAGEGVSLSGVAAHGLKAGSNSVVAAPTDARVFEACEILRATDVAVASIEAWPVGTA
jgi:hypothetical protein